MSKCLYCESVKGFKDSRKDKLFCSARCEKAYVRLNGSPVLTQAERIELLSQGKTVLGKLPTHNKYQQIDNDKELFEYAKAHDLLVIIDRTTIWGNPFEVGFLPSNLPSNNLYQKANRTVCCELHKQWILGQGKLLKKLTELQGKAIFCHCYPFRCHGMTLLSLIGKTL